MRLKYILILMLLAAYPAEAQRRQDADQLTRAQVLREDQAQREQQQGISRMKAISGANQSNASLRRKQGFLTRNKPTWNASDMQAIEIHPEDLRRFNDFLQKPKTGIVRLHDASICPPSKNIVQAESSCPNNVAGKATGYSFRRDDYTSAGFSDIYLSKNHLYAPGIFTIGIFSGLGADAGVEAQTAATDGIKQLADLTPPEDQIDVRRLFDLMKTGAEVAGKIYKSSAEVKLNETYVLRSIAYRGKVMKDAGDGVKVNVLEADERSDVLIVFRAVRKHDDGSITLIWKELARKPVPKIVLKEIE